MNVEDGRGEIAGAVHEFVQPNHMVVDIAKVKAIGVADDAMLAAGELTKDFALEGDDAPQAEDDALQAENALLKSDFRALQNPILQLSKFVLQLVDGRHIIDDEFVEKAADAQWRAAYYNNTTLSGTPVLEQQVNNINYDWGENAPAAGVNADQFSVRWTRTVNLPAGNYRFSATMDDGMRVWLDGALIIDEWRDSRPHTVNVNRELNAGDHQIRVDYYENGKNAVARFSWQLDPVTIRNWRGEYFNNMSLNGSPVAVRDDASVNFNWGMGSPLADLVPNDRFSVRWTRNIDPGSAGRYRFSVTTDDGVRLWVNNNLVIDQWHNQPATTHWADVNLPAGSIPVKMEYYETG